MRERFVLQNFHTKTLKRIDQANAIIAEMAAKGYKLTLRQLYYQFVARGYVENTKQNYDNLGNTVDAARKAGLIDWGAIEDRTRNLRFISNYTDPSNFLKKMVRYYAEDLWREQENYCEVWIEKDALVGVVEKPAIKWRVPFFACRGYPSSSELYDAAKRLQRKADAGKVVTVFYLGDHDPSGIDMTRSNDDLLAMFSRSNEINVKRLALNMDQIDQYSPPPNYAKDSDSRYSDYVEKFGEECFELDALDPEVIDTIIEDEIKALLDMEVWERASTAEAYNRDFINDVATGVSDIRRYLKYRHGQLDMEAISSMDNETVEDILVTVEAFDDGEED